eukprot:COSAG06_NODE_938_length_11391_cov_13.363974_8_plen_90_part_00
MPDSFAAPLRAHYLAAITWTDRMVGRVLAALEETGAKDAFLSHSYIKTDLFYQDRLGSNIGNIEKNGVLRRRGQSDDCDVHGRPRLEPG